MLSTFFFYEGLKYFSFYGIAYLCGLLVIHKNVKVNYTRKICHFGFIFIPTIMSSYFVFEGGGIVKLLGKSFILLSLLIYIKPIRTRIPIVATMFAAFDRPEDRPYTLLWATTQLIAIYIVLVFVHYFFKMHGIGELIYVPMLINAFGDGLAEPIGIRFGKHTYATRALFTSRKYVRSLEGSACVFIVSIITLLFFQASFTPTQLTAALLTVPLLMTVAEAVSPHTWDNPFLFLVGGFSLLGICYFL